MKRILGLVLSCCLLLMLMVPAISAKAEMTVSAPCAVLMEASTGTILYEKNGRERRSPASITKIMTLLLTFEGLENGKIHKNDDVIVSEYAASMGGSQVFLAQGEQQSLDTMIKCIVIASGNDACVAVAEHIAGSEEAFVEKMNQKAAQLGMENTHFEDCCGLSDSQEHYSCALDVAVMSRELITKYPEIFEYSKIWMEDITHVTRQGNSLFTLSSTNKLLKQYPYTTGLKTGSTSKAKYCVSATARKEDLDMIAVVMGAPDPRGRFSDARTLLTYGFQNAALYTDSHEDFHMKVEVERGVEESVRVKPAEIFRYLDLEGRDLTKVEKSLRMIPTHKAPIAAGDTAGYIVYSLEGKEIGTCQLIYDGLVPEAGYKDYFKKAFQHFLL